MTDIEKSEQENHSQKCQLLINSQKTLLLSTVSSQGHPECSYAPYVRGDSGIFYIFVSNLASHTQNMLKNNQACIMFIQPEKDTKNFFARERVSFECSVDKMLKNDDNYDIQLGAMTDKFGKTIVVLRSLPDFHLLKLKPMSGRYIAGFGQAFDINMTENSLRLKIS